MKKNEFDRLNKITTISISPKGNKIISGATSLIVWDTQTGNKLCQFNGHGDSSLIRSLQISDSGDKVLSGAIGYSAKIWDINTGKELQSLETKGEYNNSIHGIYVTGVEFRYADLVAVTANNTGVVQLWNVENGKELDYIDNLNEIYSIELSPDQETLIVQLWSSFYLLNLDTHEKSKRCRGRNATFIKNSKRIISNLGNTIQIFDVKKNELDLYKEHKLKTYQVIENFAVSPSGKEIIIGKVTNFHPVLKYNYVYDRESIDIDTGKKKKIFKEDNILRSAEYKVIKKFNQKYNDEKILFFPNGEKYLTINGSSANIWENGQ